MGPNLLDGGAFMKGDSKIQTDVRRHGGMVFLIRTAQDRLEIKDEVIVGN